MPELASFVGEIPRQAFAIQCHQATLHWLIRARLRRDPTVDEYLESGNIIRRLAFYGQAVRRPKSPLKLQPGTVLIYTGGANDHSCITNTWDTLGGYNQQGWFATGQSSKYSEHNLTEIPLISDSQVRGNQPTMKCILYRVNEVSAQENLERVLADIKAQAV